METKTKRLYEFGAFRLDPEEAVLLRDGKPVYLKPKVFETLLVLVENRGNILDKETLMQRLWQDTFVEEANLTVNISQLRKTLGKSEQGDQFIETLPRRGYRFAAEVREVWTEAALVIKEYTSSRITIEESETVGEAGRQNEQAATQIKPRAASFFGRRRSLIAAGAALLIAFLVFGVYRTLQTRPPERSQSMQLTRLTHIGNVWSAAISPDGKYVAYVAQDADKQSVWVRQAATASNLQIVPPIKALYWGLTFSPDGNQIYFLRAEGKVGTAIYQVAVLGGPIRKLIEAAYSSFAVSPDESQFAYVRESTKEKESAVIVANADGSGERTLATRRAPDFFFPHQNAIAWSPDGQTIACHAGGTDDSGYYRNVVAVQVKDGTEKAITSKRWKWIGGLAWAGDGSRLLLSASDDPAGWHVRQIWQIPFAGGEARRITNDLSGYLGMSVTADSTTALTIQETDISNAWIVPGAKLGQARPITAGDSDGRDGLAWTPDGRIVYTSRASGRTDLHLWIMDSDGSNQKPLTTGSGVHEEPSVSADGRYVVYSFRPSGDLSANIWRIDIDGSNPKQLTRGGHDVRPQCSPDGKWVLYTHRLTPTMPTLWKVSLEGGEPVKLHEDEFTYSNAISPDGTLVACVYQGKTSNGHSKIALLPIDGGPPVKLFDIPPRISRYGVIQWMPNGLAITCSDTSTTIIWKQPLDGSPPSELIDFQSDSVFRFAWSVDGSQLAVARGSRISDVVLINNFR